ncbi:MAG: CheR family methyltransferase [Actinomycetota bacterium]
MVIPLSAGAWGRAGGIGDVEEVEISLLLDGVYRRSGYDFREYSLGSLRRRLRHRMKEEGLATISELQGKVLHDGDALARLIRDLSISVTSMFRDPHFYLAFRGRVVPLLKTYPFVRVWAAGCATGEEVYSLAILLDEEGLYERTRIYATDINDTVLDLAREGVMPLSKMREYTENYIRSGGKKAFSEYYQARGDIARLTPTLSENVVFAQHNLVSDRVFNEFHVIMCRNVMIYLGAILQERVHDLFYESLAMFGILGLGHRETLGLTPHKRHYQELDSAQKLYRKVA